MADDESWIEPPGSALTAWGRDIMTAARFLTRLPLGRFGYGGQADMSALAGASRAFPIIGAAIGLGVGIVYYVLAELGVPTLAAGFAAVGAGILATGALHEDGLADTADGFGGGATREDKLEIMRDSRIGTYGVLALVASVGIRGAALGAFDDGGEALVALIAAGALSRGALPVIMTLGEPARADGLAASVGRPENWTAGIAAILGIALALLVLGPKAGFFALVGAVVAAALAAWIAQRQIEGHTGDTLGAAQQSVEATVLVIAAAAAS